MAQTPSTVRNRIGILAATALALALSPAIPAQSVFFQADDGNSFLLVPLPTETVHWINLQPARADDEPLAYPGLATAVARASLLGPASLKDRDANVLAWEKALRGAPSSGARLLAVDDHLGVAVTFRAEDLERIAELLRFRNRRSKLIRVQEHFQEIRMRRIAQVARRPHLGLLRDALNACHPSYRYGSLLERGSADTLDLDAAMAFYRWNSHPSRSINVIVGGFEAEAARKVLAESFRQFRTSIPRPGSKPAETKPIQSTIPAPGDTMMVAYPLPARHAYGVDVLVSLLAGGNDSYLPTFLGEKGHTSLQIHAQAPVAQGGRTLLIQITNPGKPIDPKGGLVRDVGLALAALVEKPVDDAVLQRAERTLRERHFRETSEQVGLAEYLARQWIRANVPNPTDLTPPATFSADELRTTAAQVLAADSQHILVEKANR